MSIGPLKNIVHIIVFLENNNQRIKCTKLLCIQLDVHQKQNNNNNNNIIV